MMPVTAVVEVIVINMFPFKVRNDLRFGDTELSDIREQKVTITWAKCAAVVNITVMMRCS